MLQVGRDTATRQSIWRRLSKPGGPYSNRTMGKQCARQRYCRIAGICSGAAHASGLPPCACVIASSRFCVLGLPCESTTKARFREKTTGVPVDVLKRQSVEVLKCQAVNSASALRRLNALTLACPARSNLICAAYLAPRFRCVSLYKRRCRLDRNVGAAAD